jgi:hypothetical protein
MSKPSDGMLELLQHISVLKELDNGYRQESDNGYRREAKTGVVVWGSTERRNNRRQIQEKMKKLAFGACRKNDRAMCGPSLLIPEPLVVSLKNSGPPVFENSRWRREKLLEARHAL